MLGLLDHLLEQRAQAVVLDALECGHGGERHRAQQVGLDEVAGGLGASALADQLPVEQDRRC